MRIWRPRKSMHFHPHPPCGGRQSADEVSEDESDFNPRPPCGGRLQKCTKTFLQICHTSQIIY